MRISSGEGKYQVWLEQHLVGTDLLFILGGGQLTHIGGVVIAEPNKQIQTIRFSNHYDYQVLNIIIESARKLYNNTIVVLGGIHIDNATKEEINIIIQNCKDLAKKLSKHK
jgi:hypothetical protein